jgi:hypothetical protein
VLALACHRASYNIKNKQNIVYIKMRFIIYKLNLTIHAIYFIHLCVDMLLAALNVHKQIGKMKKKSVNSLILYTNICFIVDIWF